MFTHTIVRSYQDSTGTSLQSSESVTADSEFNFDGTIGIGTDTEVDWAVTRANLKSLVLHSDKAMTIKTNSSSTPQETITLVANQPKIWSLGSDTITLCPFSDNVTKLYVTNAASAALKIRALCDQTPA